MALTLAQRTILSKATSGGLTPLGVRLDESSVSFLVATIINDLAMQSRAPFSVMETLPSIFELVKLPNTNLIGLTAQEAVEWLFTSVTDGDTYFLCLATLLKSRIKYSNILKFQPLPTMDQVAPRALLQSGQMSDSALSAMLYWRKFLFDLDNRAAQETGYLFQPIISSAIGGVTYSAINSPIRRRLDNGKGRQVDCVRDHYAYEIKIRVTIAASGQGRWSEELDFPKDCEASGYTPVLIVLDPTPNSKLTQLVAAFESSGGFAYVGDDAWNHLSLAAGVTMSKFLAKYVREPLASVAESVSESLPSITFALGPDALLIQVGDECVTYARSVSPYGDIAETENVGSDFGLSNLQN